jgi:hypothetical protein
VASPAETPGVIEVAAVLLLLSCQAALPVEMPGMPEVATTATTSPNYVARWPHLLKGQA